MTIYIRVMLHNLVIWNFAYYKNIRCDVLYYFIRFGEYAKSKPRFLPDLSVVITLIMRRIARPRLYSSPRLFPNILWMFQYFKKVPSLRETIASIILYYGLPATLYEGSASIEFLQLFHFRLTVRLYFVNFLFLCFLFFM